MARSAAGGLLLNDFLPIFIGVEPIILVAAEGSAVIYSEISYAFKKPPYRRQVCLLIVKGICPIHAEPVQ
jgi:hypothetical protein